MKGMNDRFCLCLVFSGFISVVQFSAEGWSLLHQNILTITSTEEKDYHSHCYSVPPPYFIQSNTTVPRTSHDIREYATKSFPLTWLWLTSTVKACLHVVLDDRLRQRLWFLLAGFYFAIAMIVSECLGINEEYCCGEV
jgi:hypothetical protein